MNYSLVCCFLVQKTRVHIITYIYPLVTNFFTSAFVVILKFYMHIQFNHIHPSYYLFWVTPL